MEAQDIALLSRFCRATLLACILDSFELQIDNSILVKLLEKLRDVAQGAVIPDRRCLNRLDPYDVGLQLHITGYTLTDFEILLDKCMALHNSTAHSSTIAHSLVYGLAEKIFDTIPADGKLVIAFAEPKLENAEIYYWFTRWLPPDQLHAAAEALHNVSFNTPISNAKLLDHHIHLTASHTSLVTRLLYANPKYVRYQLIVSKREKHIKIIHMAALISLIAETLSYLECNVHGYPGSVQLHIISNHVDNALRSLRAGRIDAAVYELRRALARILRGRWSSSVLSPLLLLTNAKDAHEAMRRFHETCLNMGWPGRSASFYAIALAASILIHNYITFHELYSSLELMARVYQRIELPLAQKLISLVFRQGVSAYYSRVEFEPKISGKSLRNWHLLRYAAKAIGSNVRPVFRVVYLSMVKKGNECTTSRLYLCNKAVQNAYRVVKTLITLRRARYYSEKLAASTSRIGVDVAGAEKRVPNWPYTIHIVYLRGRYPDTPVSFHAGEDFYHTFNGLRKIWEAIEYSGLRVGDRIGHAVALYAEQSLVREEYEPLLEAISDVAFALVMSTRLNLNARYYNNLALIAAKLCNIAGLSNCNPWSLAEAYETLYNPRSLLATLNNINPSSPLARHLQRMFTPSTPASRPAAEILNQILHDPRVIGKLVKEYEETRFLAERLKPLVPRLQEELRAKLREKGITIESCPSSNHSIVGVNYGQHPLHKMMDDVDVVVGSDDPALLAIDPIVEEKIVEALLSQKLPWQDRVNRLSKLF